jgi:hypothetical protein
LKRVCNNVVKNNAPIMNNYVISPEFADPGGYEAVTEYYGDG